MLSLFFHHSVFSRLTKERKAVLFDLLHVALSKSILAPLKRSWSGAVMIEGVENCSRAVWHYMWMLMLLSSLCRFKPVLLPSQLSWLPHFITKNYLSTHSSPYTMGRYKGKRRKVFSCTWRIQRNWNYVMFTERSPSTNIHLLSGDTRIVVAV